MKRHTYKIPKEIRSNRVEDLFEPCWIVKAVRSDSIDSTNKQGWISMVVFEDTRQMLEMIGDWGRSLQRSGKEKQRSMSNSPG